MFYFPKLSSDICEGVVGLELVACQTWFSWKALAATSFPPWPIGLPFSCPWRRDGRTVRSLDRQWKRGKRDDFLMGSGSRAVWLREGKMVRSWTQQLNPPSVSGKVFSSSLLSFLSLPALILNSPSWGTLFCLPSLSLSSHNQPADRQTSAVIDDASPSPTTFSLGPWSEIGQHQRKAGAGPSQCLWGPFAVFSHPSHDPHMSHAGLEQTGADHAAPSPQNVHHRRATTFNFSPSAFHLPRCHNANTDKEKNISSAKRDANHHTAFNRLQKRCDGEKKKTATI